MLNELYHLSVALEKAGITPRDWHKELKPLPRATLKKPCYKILLGPDGSISGIEPMKEELVGRLRKWEPSNGNSFPGFNIQPLYRLTDEERKKRFKKWREGKDAVDIVSLRNWCAAMQSRNWDAQFSKKLAKCLGEIPSELQKRCGKIPGDFAPIKTLFERVSVWGNDLPGKLFQGLESYLWTAIEKGESSASLLPILVYEGSSRKNPQDDRGSISVFLDVPDWRDYPVAHEKTIGWINDRLLQTEGVGGGSARESSQ